MIKNYFSIAIRNIVKHRTSSIINILGLAIGMAVFMIIALYVHFERSYEDFIPNKENIYRVSLSVYKSGEQTLTSAENYPGVGPALQKEIPEVINYARLYNMGYKNNVVITNENERFDAIAFKHRKFLYADGSFLPMMGYEMIKGNATTALTEPLTAVISQKYAQLYFGNQNPIGKTLRLHDDDNNNELVTVTGVIKDIPSNTHLAFDVLFSYSTLYTRGDGASAFFRDGWRGNNSNIIYTYVELKPGTEIGSIMDRLPPIVDKYKPELKSTQEKQLLGFQPLKDIHLYSDLAEEPETNGNSTIVFSIGIIGIFILIIAWINYINLTTARTLTRSKEVGIRKVAGAFRYQLVIHFLTEAAVTNLFSIAIAFGLVRLLLPGFNILSGLSLTPSYLVNAWFIGLIGLVWIGGTLFSGLYPAFVLSSFKPVVVLKGKFSGSSSGMLLRKGLVVAQFTAAVALIGGTIIVYKQLCHMMNSNTGMNIHQMLVVERPGKADADRNTQRANIDLFRNEINKNPSVETVTASLTIPGKQREYKLTVKNFSSNQGDSIEARVNGVDYDFFNAFKMKLLAGRNFSSDDGSVILSELAVQKLGFKNMDEAIGKAVVMPRFGNSPRTIIGVVNDYHQLSFKKALEPTLFLCVPYGGEFYSMRIHTSHLQQAIQDVRQSWAKAFPGNPFEYFFLDDYFNQQYANEQKFEKLFSVFAILAIIISCLGLFGLSSYSVTQRFKEIGIRKVLGASAISLTSLLSKEFLKLILVAAIIGSVLAYFLMNKWLQDFAYRINISWWTFLQAGTIAIVIAILTICAQTIKAAIANPVKSLKTE